MILLVGQPGAGKTTLGKILANILECSHLDGDLNREEDNNFDYTKQGRKNNVNSILKKAKNIKGQKVISMVCPYVNLQHKLRSIDSDFKGIFLYTSQKRGKEKYHVKDFQIPSDYLMVDTNNSIKDCILKILSYI